MCDPTTVGPVTLTLPAGSSAIVGLWYTIKIVVPGTNICTVDGNGSDTIEGAADFTTMDAFGDTITVVYLGANAWGIISKMIN